MYRDKKGKLTAYAKPLADGLFERKECMNEKTQWKGTQDLVTPKGRENVPAADGRSVTTDKPALA